MCVLRTLYARRYKQRWYGCLPLFSSTRLLESRFSLHFYWHNNLFLLVLLLFLSSSTVSVSGLFPSLSVAVSLARVHCVLKYISHVCVMCVCTFVCFRHDPRPFLFVLLFYQITHMKHLIVATQIINAYPAISLYMLCKFQFKSVECDLLWAGGRRRWGEVFLLFFKFFGSSQSNFPIWFTSLEMKNSFISLQFCYECVLYLPNWMAWKQLKATIW